MRIPSLGMLMACLLLAAPQAALAKDPVFPALTGPVVDLADEIPADREAALDAKLRAYMKRTGHQLQIVTLKDMQGMDREEYANKLFDHWRLGRAGVDDGMMILHSIAERAIRIEIGSGAEAYMTDADTTKIRVETITPAFKAGRFADGIEQGADQMMALANTTTEQRAEDDRKAAMAQAKRSQESKDSFLSFLFWAAVTIGSIVAGWFGWRLATLPKRRRLAREAAAAEAERLRLRRERDAAAAKEREEEAEREAERGRVAEIARAAAIRAAEEQRQRDIEKAALDRKNKLAAMTPAARQLFLDAEAAERRAEAERQRLAEEQRRIRQEEERLRQKERDRQKAIADREENARRARREEERREQQRRDDEESSRNAAIIAASSYGSSNSSTSSSPSSWGSSDSGSSWGGGGGDSSGGGSGGDY